MPSITTTDLTIHYRRAGNGDQPVVFLHGNFASSRWWVPQLERIPSCATGFAPDLRGCGGEEGRTECHQSTTKLTVDALSSDLEEFIDALKLKRPILVGHSLGGVIVTDYALRHPDQVGGLVLVDSGPPEGLPLAIFSDTYVLPLRFGTRSTMRVALMHAGMPREGALADAMVDDTVSTDLNQYVALGETIAHWNVEAALPELNIPTLLIWGSHDRIMSPRIGRRYLELVPRARLIIIGKAGHSPQVERPDRFAVILRAFIGQLVPTRAQKRRFLVL